MLWVARIGLYTLRQSYFSKVFTRLPVFVARRNMSSQGKRPISLLGTMAFGGRADADKSMDIVKTFLGRGNNEVDTAFMYTDGQSETIIGGMNLPKTGTSLISVV